MGKRIGIGKEQKPRKDSAWFRRKVAELKREAERLPVDRQERLKKEIERKAQR